MKNLIWMVFGLMVVFQLFMPLNMIYKSRQILDTGTEFHFACAPVDPSDPFRGKYITLDFKLAMFETQSGLSFVEDQDVFAFLKTDSLGMASIHKITSSKPNGPDPYIKLKINWISQDTPIQIIHFHIPFNRFYLDEFDAPEAERVYRENLIDNTELPTYGVVFVKNGESRIKDVMIGNRSIKEYLGVKPEE